LNWHDLIGMVQLAVTGLLLPLLNSAKRNAAEAARLATRVNGHDREMADIKAWLARVEDKLDEALIRRLK